MVGHGQIPARVRLTAMIAVISVATLLSGCGSERSEEAFCKQVAAGHERLAQTFEARNLNYANTDDVLVQLANVVGGLLEVQEEVLLTFRGMADAAPDEVRADAERLAELYEQQIEQSSGVQTSVAALVGGLVEVLLGAVRTSSHLERVDLYAQEHCGMSADPIPVV